MRIKAKKIESLIRSKLGKKCRKRKKLRTIFTDEICRQSRVSIEDYAPFQKLRKILPIKWNTIKWRPKCIRIFRITSYRSTITTLKIKNSNIKFSFLPSLENISINFQSIIICRERISTKNLQFHFIRSKQKTIWFSEEVNEERWDETPKKHGALLWAAKIDVERSWEMAEGVPVGISQEMLRTPMNWVLTRNWWSGGEGSSRWQLLIKWQHVAEVWWIGMQCWQKLLIKVWWIVFLLCKTSSFYLFYPTLF